MTGYSIAGKDVSRREFIAHQHGQDVADAVEDAVVRGVYQLAPGAGYLTVGQFTFWPGSLSLDSVFPLDVSKLHKDHSREGGMGDYMVGSKPVQNDMKALNKSVAVQYEKLQGLYTTSGNPNPGAIADIRAFRKETRAFGRRYAWRAGRQLEIVRRIVAVLFLEARRVFDPAPHTLPLDSDARNGVDEVRSRFVTYFWQSALNGGPRHVTDADALARWLYTEGASEELLRFQCHTLYAVLELRDKIVTEALPVEIHRIACGRVLWKVARGQLVEAWTDEDTEVVKEDLKRGRGSPPISEERQKAIYDLAKTLVKKNPKKYAPIDGGTLVRTALRDKVALKLGESDTTVRRYLEKDPGRWL